MNCSSKPPQRLIVLGSTGSIGVNTLNVVEHLNQLADDTAANGSIEPIQIVGLAAGRQADRLIEQARRFKVPAVAISDASQAQAIQSALPSVTVYAGPEAAVELVEHTDATDVSAAVVGSAGLPATLAAIRKGLKIGLANKETLVAAGALVTPMVRQHHATLIPVDSEHSAIFQCLQGPARQTQGYGYPSVKQIVLTASGGPFRCVDRQTMQTATIEQALNHPTWNMGPKITIDSATMMNKALEIIEAHWLFGLEADRIKVIIHPQSIVHSFVEFADHSVLAQLGSPDMKTPIQYALVYPQRLPGCSAPLDWSTLSTLGFEQPDNEKFASLQLAYEVIKAGGTAGAILNGANEAAVAAFLERKIRFGRIVELVAQALDAVDVKPADSLEAILEADKQARGYVDRALEHRAVQVSQP